MPFTPSHIAAALPFVPTPLPVAPLVIGTMAPDVPYFLPLRIPRDLTHSLPGVPTVDLAITLVLVALWYLALRAPVVDLLPSAIRERIPAPGVGRYRSLRGIALGVVAALVGILTHLVWDAFTHASSSVVQAVPFLHARLGPFEVSSWLQYLSSIGGLLALALWVRSWARRTARVPSRSVSSPAARVWAWGGIALVFALVASAIELAGMRVGIDPLSPSRIFVSVTVAGGAAGLVALLICAAWWTVRGVRLTRS